MWAVKTVYLLELASRQRYPGARPVEGYQPSISETGWLLAQFEQRPTMLVEPPPRTMVWLACWDCKTADAVKRASTVSYAPSAAPVPISDGREVIGQFTTLAVGFAVFQVFTVDYVQAEVRKAVAGTLARQTVSLMRSASSGHIVYALAMSGGPHRLSRTTALTD